jgi:hypothetical protein
VFYAKDFLIERGRCITHNKFYLMEQHNNISLLVNIEKPTERGLEETFFF